MGRASSLHASPTRRMPRQRKNQVNVGCAWVCVCVWCDWERVCELYVLSDSTLDKVVFSEKQWEFSRMQPRN